MAGSLRAVSLDQFTNSTIITPNQRDEYINSVMSYFRKIMTIVKAVVEAQKSSILKPFDHADSYDTVYRLYIQPVLFLLSLVAFIWMTIKTRKDKCFKSYVLTVTFLLNDTIGMFLPLPFHFAFLPDVKGNSGLDYRLCETFRVLVTFLPQALYYHSQWLKFVACLFECLSIYFPGRALWLYRKRFLTSLLLASLLVATAISSLMQYDVEFEKFSYYDKTIKQVVQTCIMVPSYIYDVNSGMYNLIRIIAPMTIGIILPLICMIIGSIILLIEISSKSSTLSRLKSKKMHPTSKSHVRFVTATSLFYIFELFPRLSFESLLVNELSRRNIYGTWTVGKLLFVSTIVYHFTVPATVLIYNVMKRLPPSKAKTGGGNGSNANNSAK